MGLFSKKEEPIGIEEKGGFSKNKFIIWSSVIVIISLIVWIYTYAAAAFIVFMLLTIIALNLGARKKDDSGRKNRYIDKDFD